jgi:hypothetical protein
VEEQMEFETVKLEKMKSTHREQILNSQLMASNLKPEWKKKI